MTDRDPLLDTIAAGVQQTAIDVQRLDGNVQRLEGSVQRLEGKFDDLKADLNRLERKVDNVLDDHTVRIEQLETLVKPKKS